MISGWNSRFSRPHELRVDKYGNHYRSLWLNLQPQIWKKLESLPYGPQWLLGNYWYVLFISHAHSVIHMDSMWVSGCYCDICLLHVIMWAIFSCLCCPLLLILPHGCPCYFYATLPSSVYLKIGGNSSFSVYSIHSGDINYFSLLLILNFQIVKNILNKRSLLAIIFNDSWLKSMPGLLKA